MQILKEIKSRLQQGRDQLRRLIGRWLFDTHREPVAEINNLKHVLIIRWDAKLGDSIVSSWFARELKMKNPSIQVDVIAPESLSFMYEDYFKADIVYPSKKRPGYSDLNKLAKKIGQVDLLIHFGKKLKMKDIYFINKVKARFVAGLDDELNSINIKLGQITEGKHFCEKFATLAKKCGITDPDKTYILPYTDTHIKNITPTWPKNSPVITINPYGSGSSRKLSSDNIKRLISYLTSGFDKNVQCCLLFSPETKNEVIELTESLNNTFCCKESKSIGDVIAQIALSDGIVSVDTATIHIASGLSKPILGLYNPDMINFSEWGPNTPTSHIVFSKKTAPIDINQLPWDELEKDIQNWWHSIKMNQSDSNFNKKP